MLCRVLQLVAVVQLLLLLRTIAAGKAAEYFGTKCKPQNRHGPQAKRCSMLGGREACLKGVTLNCFLWGKGTFDPPLVPGLLSSSRINTSNLCSSCLVDGDFSQPADQSKDPLWSPHGCKLYLPSPAELLYLFRGRTIVILGDSMMRHVYLRLIAHIRNQKLIYGRVFHTDSAYTFWPSGDNLTVFNDKTLSASEWEELTRAAPKGSARIFFMWCTTGIGVKSVLAARPAMLIAGLHYHVQDVPHSLRDQVQALHKKGGLNSKSIFLVNVPLLGVNESVLKATAHINERNFEMYRSTFGLVQYVPFSSITSRSPYARVAGLDHKHYQCAIVHPTPEMMAIPGMEVIRRPSADPLSCRDLNNLSVLRLILSSVFRQFVLQQDG